MIAKLIITPVRSNGLWMNVKKKWSWKSIMMIEVIEALIIILLLIGYGIMCCVLGYKIRQTEEDDD